MGFFTILLAFVLRKLFMVKSKNTDSGTMTAGKTHQSPDVRSEELSQADSEIHSLFAALSDCIFVVDDQGTVRKVLETNLEVQKISPLSFLGKTLDQIISTESGQIDSILEKIQSTLRGKTPASFEYTVRDGNKKHWFRATISPLDDHSVFWIAQDITDRKETERQLRLLAQTVMSSTDCVSITDLNDTILFVNKAFINTYGYSEEELIGKNITIVRSPLMDPEIGNQMAIETLNNGWNGEILNRHKNGTDFYLELWTSAVRDDEGNPFALVGVARDLSERKKAEAEIRRSETKYHMLFEYANDPIIILRPADEQVLEVNRKACEVYGYTREEFTSMSLRSITKNPERGDLIIQTILREGKHENISSVHFAKDGKEIHVHSNAYVIEYDGQQAIVAIIRDITSRVMNEARLRENEGRLRLISENVKDYIAILDAEGTYQYVTDSFRLMGYNPAVIPGTSILDYVHPEDRARFANELRIVTDTYTSRSFEFRFRRFDETWMSTEIIISMMVSDAGIELVIAMRDITRHKQAEETLLKERILLRTVIDNIPDLIYTKDTACRKTLANAADVHNMGAKSEAEVLGKDDFAFYPKESADKFFADDQSVIQTGQPVINREEYVLDENGQKRWLLTSKLPLRDQKGQIIGLAGIGHDITKRKLAEEELYKSEAKLRLIMDSAFDGISIYEESLTDKKRKLVECNRRYAEMAGRSKEELLRIGDTIPLQKSINAEMNDQSIWDVAGDVHSGLLREGKNYQGLFSWIRPDGKENIIEYNAVPIKIDGKIITIGLDRDITDRVQIEEKLRNERILLRTLIDSAPESIYTKDLACRKTLANPSDVRDMKAKSEAEVLGKDDFEFYPKELAEGFYADDQRVIQTGQPVINKEEYVIDEKGQKRWLLTSKLPLRDQKSQIVGLVGIGRDITKRKLAEEELRKSEEKLRLIFDNAFDGISVYEESLTDRKQRLVECNRRYAEMAGRSKEELLEIGNTLPLQKAIDSEASEYGWLDAIGDLQSGMLREGKNFKGIFSWIRPDGKENIVEYSAVPINIEGKIITIGLDHDITDRMRIEEALRNERILLRTVIDNLPDAIYAKDKACRKTLANLADARNMGLESESEVLGKDDFELFPKELAEGFLNDDQSVIQSGQPVLNREEYVLDEKGQKRWLLTSKLPLRDQKDQIVGLVGIGRDITKHKQAEEILQESEKRYRELFDEAPVGYHELDVEGRITRVNETELKMLGYTAEEMIGQYVWKFAADEEQSNQRTLAKLVGTIPPSQGVARVLQRKDGSELPILLEDRLLRDADGKITGIRTIVQDITELKRVEEALEHEHNLLRTLIDLIPDYIYVKDTESRFILGNTALIQSLGKKTMEEIYGKTDFDFHLPEAAEEYFADEQEIFRTGRPLIDKEGLIIESSGEMKWNITTKIPLRDSQGKIIGLVGNGRNITKRKLAEDKLRRSEENFKRMASNIEDIIYSVDAETMEYRYLSPAFERILGYTEDDIRMMGGRRSFLSKIILEEKYMRQDQIVGDITSHQRSGGADYYEAWWRCKDGTVKCLEDHWIPVFQEGRLVSTDGIMRDITERKKADEELHQSEENFQRMASRIDEVLYSIGEDKKEFRYLSPVFKQTFGYTIENIQQMGGLREFFSIVTPDQVFAPLREEIDNPTKASSLDVSTHQTTWWRCKDGSLKFIENRWIALYEGNRLVRIDGVLRDMTEQQRLEEERRTFEEKLKRRNIELEQMLADLQEMQGKAIREENLAAVSRLTTGIADEIDTPLTTLANVLKNANFDILAKNSPQLLRQVSDGVHQIKKVIDQLRRISQSENTAGIDLIKSLNETFPPLSEKLKPKITVLKK